MFESISNFSKLIKTAGTIGPRIKAMKQELDQKEVDASSGDGLVRVKMTGTGNILKVSIKPATIEDMTSEQLAARDTAICEAVRDATNLAIIRAKQLHMDAIRVAVADLNIPGIDSIIEQMS